MCNMVSLLNYIKYNLTDVLTLKCRLLKLASFEDSKLYSDTVYFDPNVVIFLTLKYFPQ